MVDKMYKTHYLAKASIAQVQETEVEMKDLPAKTNAASEPMSVDTDLMKLVSVLFSIGMNKNDDCFVKEEVLPARHTGAHKPVDIEHDPNHIVGHMLRSYVTTKSGEMIDDEMIEKDASSCPDDFDVTNEAVIYKYLLPEKAEQIESAAKQGKLFVSVEAWFTDYDYLVGNKIVKRNEKTSSILDEVLRINGGPGLYKGQKVGRVLRNMLIGGVGLVEKPANPDSVIRSINHTQDLDISTLDADVSSNVIGSLPVQQVVATEVTPEVTSATSGYVAIEGNVPPVDGILTITSTDKTINQEVTLLDFNQLPIVIELKQKVSELDSNISSISAKHLIETSKLEELLQMRNGEIWSLEIDKEALVKELEGYKSKVKEIEMAKSKEERTLILKGLNFKDDFIKNELTTCENMSPEDFIKHADYLKMIVNSVNVKTVADEPKPEGGEPPATPPSSDPAPAPVVTPTTEPAPAPVPNPQPTPAPAPVPAAPVPAPAPDPAPVVAPTSAPEPQPVPAPAPAPKPADVPATPDPEPVEDDADDDGDVSIDSATPVDLDITPVTSEPEEKTLFDQFKSLVDQFVSDRRKKLKV